VARHSVLRTELQDAGVSLREHAGTARFVDPHTIEAEQGIRLNADKIILCAGGTHRPLPVPGAELAGSHRDAWTLTTVPESLLVIGAGATGAQVASVFAELGTRVTLFEAGPRILATEDEDVSRAMAASFRGAGIEVRENFGRIRGFEKTPAGVRMVFAKDDVVDSVEATMAVVAIGWLADTAGLNLAAAGVATNDRGYVQVDEHLRTTAPNVFAAGDITGRIMLVPHAVEDGYLAATNAVLDRGATLSPPATPIGSFTDPEYAQVGPTEAQARRDHDVVVATVPFAVVPRPIIDGRPDGFCKLIVDRGTHRILGCHVVGERAVELAQVAAVAVAAAMPVEQFARIPLSFPTYTNVLGRAALDAARQLGVPDLSDAPEPATRGT
jgi:pyruvate/2-oxoglutarate dehydrogenase complex dihydrolipoamide dehydrogenase (E3) component